MKTRIVLTLMLGSWSLNACAFGSKRVTEDQVSRSSIIDGDATALSEGCGDQPSPLGMFCRMQEGDASDKHVWFIGPPAKCTRSDACVFVKVWNNEGALVWGGQIPKGETRVQIDWKKLIGRDAFVVGDRGFWTFNTQVFWVDQDGNDRDSTAQGDIVLRVYKKGYIPLNSVQKDPNYAWIWSEGKYCYKMTTGMRTSVFAFDSGKTVCQ